jgi:hypothetical protein
MGRQVQFLICGAQKAGTTALDGYLRQHPQLFLPDQKEQHFFDDESIVWTRPPYKRYHGAFEQAPRDCLWGEATPIYMYWEPCAGRIWRYNPAMRLIAILRNPIDRAYSHWNMEHQRGQDPACFLDAIRTETQRCRASLPLQHRIFSYIERGFYSQQLRRLWRFFNRDQVLVLNHDDLRNTPQTTLNRVYAHLGVEPMAWAGEQLQHVGHYGSPMPSEAKALLRQVFWHEICQLESLLGWDCHHWLASS